MAAVFDQLLGSNQSKTAGTSLVISPVSKTVTVGKTIFVAYAGDDVGSAFGITDNLGNTYTQQKETIQGGVVKTQLWSARVTTGGSITAITVAWTTNVTAKAAVAGEFSNFGSSRSTGGLGGGGTETVVQSTGPFWQGELWVGAAGVEDDVVVTFSGTTGTPAQTKVAAGSNGTTGGASTSNISVTLGYLLIDADSTVDAAFRGNNSGAQNNAGAGAFYDAKEGGKGWKSAAASQPPGLDEQMTDAA